MGTPINPNLVEIVKVTELPTLELALENYFAHCGVDGTLYKLNIQGLVDFIAPYLSALGSSPFVANTGSPLPNPIEKPTAITFVGVGNFDQTTGSNVVTTEELNVLFWSSNGVTGTWILGVAIPIDLSGYTTKEETNEIELRLDRDLIKLDRKNIFNKNEIQNGQLVSVGGSLPIGAAKIVIDANYDTTGYIEVEEGKSYIIQGVIIGSDSCFLGVFKTKDISEEGVRINSNNPTIPPTYKYLVFTTKSTTFTADLDLIQVEEGNVETSIVPFSEATIPDPYIKLDANLFDYTKYIPNRVLSFGAKKSPAEVYTSILADASLANWSFTGYIPVKEGKIYELIGLTLSNSQCGSFFDGNKAPIGTTFVADSVTYVASLNGNRWKAPIGAKYWAANLDRPTELKNKELIVFREYNGDKNFYPDQNYFTDNDSEVSVITPNNATYIVWYGNSYTASHYSLISKSWIRKLSNLFDWNIANFAVSGNSFIDVKERMSLGINPFSVDAPLSVLNPKIIILALIGNERINLQAGQNQFFYERELENTINTAKSYGADVILGTDHVINNKANDATLSGIAKKHNIPYISFGAKGQVINLEGYLPFWSSHHPGTRTNTFTFSNWTEYFSTMPRPMKSLKVFRQRAESTGLSLTDLQYNNNAGRNVNFNEISIGEYALSDSNNYDKIDTNFTNSIQVNEYASLMAQRNVNVGNRPLIEFVCDRIKFKRALVKLSINTDVDVYIRTSDSMDELYTLNGYRDGAAYEVSKSVYDAFSFAVDTSGFTDTALGGGNMIFKGKIKSFSLKKVSGYYLFFKGVALTTVLGSGTILHTSGNTSYLNGDPDISQQPYKFYAKKTSYNWTLLPHTYSDGILTAEINEDKYQDFDKVSILLVGSNILLKYAQLFTSGGIKKIEEKPRLNEITTNSDLLPVSSFGSLGSWTSTGTIVSMPSDVRDYPSVPVDNNHMQLEWDSDNFPQVLSRDITIPNVSGFSSFMKLKIKVVARIFPKIFSGTDGTWTTSTAQAGTSSYDFGTLCVGFKPSAGFNGSIQYKTIGFGWAEYIFDVLVSPHVGSGKLSIWRDEEDYTKRTSSFPLQVHSVRVEIVS